TVTAQDPFGNLISGYTGTIAFSSTDATATLPGTYTFTTGASADNGVHVFPGGTVFRKAGSQTLSVKDTVTTTATGSQTGITVSASNATSIAFSGGASTVGAGNADTFVLTAFDTFGNVATGYTGQVKFASSDTAAVVPANYTFKAVDAGTHLFSVTFQTAGSQ